MKVYLAADHAGFKLKESVKKWLVGKGYDVFDFGAHEYKKMDDYPDFMHKVGTVVSKDKESRGLIFGGSGQGEAVVCNRYKGVRAAVYYAPSPKAIKLSREHNNANVLALGGFFLKEKEALKAVELWLKTPFKGAVRHKRRINKIDK